MHPVFEEFDLRPAWSDGTFAHDAIGSRRRIAFHDTEIEVGSLGCDRPPFTDEYFEWVDVLDAVATAQGSFTMVELGAGYGRWVARGVAAARQRGLATWVVAVEAEPTHFNWLLANLEDNGITDGEVHHAAVNGGGGVVRFHVGDPYAWYGQAIHTSAVPVGAAEVAATDLMVEGLLRRDVVVHPERGIVLVPALTLGDALAGLERVDLIDMDIQGAELEVLEAGVAELGRVRVVHVATHGPEIEADLRRLFADLGWRCRWDFPCLATAGTPYGPVAFGDGVQTWLNPAFPERPASPRGPGVG